LFCFVFGLLFGSGLWVGVVWYLFGVVGVVGCLCVVFVGVVVCVGGVVVFVLFLV
jgi:hypothetical protein